ncbi:MAG: purine-nucleoside phosphorylase [Vulcanimicrobiaceae bacterium]
MNQLAQRAGGELDFAIVLGTGLSALVTDLISGATKIPYSELGFPHATLPGHAGEAIVGSWRGKRVAAFAGRLHLYQGFDARTVTAPVALAREAGAGTLVVTNAAGGLNQQFQAGDLMLIVDQINMTGTSPLVGTEDPSPFVDMLKAYDPALADVARRRAAQLRVGLAEGVYLGLLGPAFETPAEARWLRSIADAVGMSTVLETIRARRLGMRVLGISVITNVVGKPSAHGDVIAQCNASAPNLSRLLDAIVPEL